MAITINAVERDIDRHLREQDAQDAHDEAVEARAEASSRADLISRINEVLESAGDTLLVHIYDESESLQEAVKATFERDESAFLRRLEEDHYASKGDY